MAKSVRFCLILVFLLGFTVLCGCTGNVGAGEEQDNKNKPSIEDSDIPAFGISEGLDAETERQIKQDFLETIYSYYTGYTVDDIQIRSAADTWIYGPNEGTPILLGYLGTYNGCAAICFSDNREEAVDTFIPVAGFNFGFSVSAAMFAWKQGRFYGVQEAYDLGFLTEADIRTMYKWHHGYSPEKELHIKRDFLYNHLDARYRSKLKVDDVYIETYFYAFHNGCIPVIINAYGLDTGRKTAVTVAGYEFHYPNSNVILVWQQDSQSGLGRFYRVGEAYNLGLLSQSDDLEFMYYLYNKGGLFERKCSTGEEPGNMPAFGISEGLDAETERQIKQDYLNSEYGKGYSYTVDDIQIRSAADTWIYGRYYANEFSYLGTYNGCAVFYILGDMTVSYGITVAGFEFGFPVYSVMLAWKDGHFYDVRKAYNVGFLTEADVRTMYKWHYGYSPEIELQIRRDYLYNHLDARYQSELTVDDVYIETYCYSQPFANGYYFMEGCYPVIMNANGLEDSNALLLWKEDIQPGSSRFYGVDEAYNLGLLSQEEAQSMHIPNSNILLLQKQNGQRGSGHLYGVEEAYNLGLLSQDDVQSIHGLYPNSNVFLLWKQDGQPGSGRFYGVDESYHFEVLYEE